jgi:hypothetical protein
MTTTVAQLDGLYKQVYADGIENLIPETSILTKNIKFAPRKQQLGNRYNQPVVVQQEHGITYASGSDTGTDVGAFDIVAARSMKTQNATVVGSQMLASFVLSYEAAQRAASGVNAFRDATQLQLENGMESMSKRLEMQLLYGQSGWGNASAISGSSTSRVLTISAGTWATAIWSGMENALVTLFNGTTGALFGALGTATAPGTAAMTITAVNAGARQITISGDATVLTAVDAAIADTVDIYPFTSRVDATTFNEAVGLNKITTTTGTLFGINTATYGLYRSNTYSVGGNLTFDHLQKAVAVAVARGLAADVDVIVNPAAWVTLLNTQAGNRRFDSSYSSGKVTNGGKTIEFYSQNGVLRIHSHIYCKVGDGFVVPFEELKRVGATDITNTVAGGQGTIFRHLETKAGFEHRLYSNQALFCKAPAKLVKLTGITV